MKKVILFIFIKIMNCNNIFLLFENSEINIKKYISVDCNIGLLGFTPHPTSYMTKEGSIESFENILFEDIIDLKEFQDSISKTILCAMRNNIKVLVCAYLPVYYKTIMERYGEKKAMIIYHDFMMTYGEVIKNYFLSVAQQLKYEGDIIISIPPAILLSDIKNIDYEKRSYFLIKHFPVLLFENAKKYTIIIINGNPSYEDDEIIYFLNEKYKLNYDIVYRKDYIHKEKFHIYK